MYWGSDILSKLLTNLLPLSFKPHNEFCHNGNTKPFVQGKREKKKKMVMMLFFLAVGCPMKMMKS